MRPYGTLTLAMALLRHHGRVSYQALKCQFDLDEESLDALRIELVEVHRVAADLDGRMLVWNDGRPPPAAIAPALKTVPDPRPSLASLGAASPAAAALAPPVEPAAAPAAEAPAPRGVEAERRQLTVLFCDLVGSTPLSERLDPEDLRTLLQNYQAACHEVIDRFEGYLARYFGDGLLVYFGYPRAHEDDAQRAVLTGLEIVRAMEGLNAGLPAGADVRLDVRIGIHTGLVVAGDMDDEHRLESMAVVGDTPNVAARIQGAAEPNTVVISAATAQLLWEAFTLEDLGPHALKGVAEPVTLARVVGEAEEPLEEEEITPDYAIPLVGRDEELGLLRRRWEQSKEGLGQVVMICGEGGIGKSRLLDALGGQVDADPHVRIAFYCSPYHTNSALYPVIRHLQRLLRFGPGDPAAAKLDKLERALRACSLPAEEVVPLFAALLSVPLLDRYPAPALTAQQQKQQTLDALVAWLLEEAENRAVVAVWEDLQWADPSTLELLGLLIDQIPTAHLFGVFTYRPDFVTPWPTRSHMTPITLNRLERPQMEAMIGHLAQGKRLPPEVVQHIVTKTDGVPLYVEELTKMILESDVLREGEDRYELTGSLAEVRIPATLQDSLMARLDRLPTVREVAQLAAVFGREFAYEMLSSLVPLEESVLQNGLAQLVDAELLYRRGRGQRARYMFKHALIRDAAYGSLLKSRRQQCHEQIAKTIEARLPEVVETQPELLAHHYQEAGRIEAAIRYWQRAGERALARSATTEAVNHLKAGLGLLEHLPDAGERNYYELRLLTTLGPALMTTVGYAAPETKQVYTRARELCQQAGETPELFPIVAGLWRFHLLRAEYGIAKEFAAQLLSLAERLGDRAFQLEAIRSLGSTLFYRGELTAARRHLEEGIRVYDRRQHGALGFRFGQDPGVACRSYGSWTLWLLGYPEQAREQSRDAIALAEEIEHPFSLALALSFASWLHQFRREPGLTRERAEAALALSVEQGFQFWVGWDALLRCWALAGDGNGGAVLEEMRQGLETWLATGSQLGRPYFLALLAEVSGAAGHVEEGLALLEEALALAEATEERWWEAELHRLKGELCLRANTGREADAETCFRQALEVARAQEARALELRAAVSLSRLWRERGESAEARRTLGEVCGRFPEEDGGPELREARALLAAMA